MILKTSKTNSSPPLDDSFNGSNFVTTMVTNSKSPSKTEPLLVGHFLNGPSKLSKLRGRNTYMVRENHVTVLLINHISVLCIELYINGGFHAQIIYMIGLGI